MKSLRCDSILDCYAGRHPHYLSLIEDIYLATDEKEMIRR